MITVSGCRGVVGGSLTPETICRYVGAFSAWLEEQKAPGDGPVVVGRDGRRGGDVIADIAMSALRASGRRVIDLGIAMTATTGLMVRRHNGAGGLVVTASHNPAEWNGLKPLTADGRAPDASQAERIVTLFHEGRRVLAPHDALGARDGDDTGHHAHVAAVLEAIDRVVNIDQIKRRGVRVALDSLNCSGAVGGMLLLDALGCELIHVNRDSSGDFPHPPEPIEEHLKDLCMLVKESFCDIGFAQDPDADRLVIVDEKGTYIGEEYTLALGAEALLGAGGFGSAATLAANLSTSRMIDDVAKKHRARVVRTPVGEANVVSAMVREGCALGGEGNGGVVWPEIVHIRDSLSAIALTLALMTRENASLSELVGRTPAYAIDKRKVAIREGLADKASAAIRQRWSKARIDTQDGVRIDLDDEGAWLHVRASNTEPILRLIAEAPTKQRAAALLDEAQSVIEGA